MTQQAVAIQTQRFRTVMPPTIVRRRLSNTSRLFLFHVCAFGRLPWSVNKAESLVIIGRPNYTDCISPMISTTSYGRTEPTRNIWPVISLPFWLVLARLRRKYRLTTSTKHDSWFLPRALSWHITRYLKARECTLEKRSSFHFVLSPRLLSYAQAAQYVWPTAFEEVQQNIADLYERVAGNLALLVNAASLWSASFIGWPRNTAKQCFLSSGSYVRYSPLEGCSRRRYFKRWGVLVKKDATFGEPISDQELDEIIQLLVDTDLVSWRTTHDGVQYLWRRRASPTRLRESELFAAQSSNAFAETLDDVIP